MRLRRVDVDVCVLVGWFGLTYPDDLMPAMHSGNRIGMNWKGEVLMNADVVPPNARRVAIA